MAPKKEPEKEPQKQPVVLDADEVIRTYYESTTEDAFPEDVMEPVSSVRDDRHEHATELAAGDVDAAADPDVGEETVGGSIPTPDQDIVDEIGKAAGVTYQDNEPLRFDDKLAERDERRWELDPASSEDYQERTAGGERSSSPSGTTSPGPTETRPAKPKSKKAAGGRKAARARPPS